MESINKEKKSGVLVLTRRIGESIIIGDNIEVVILGVHGAQVRVGVNAPRDVKVWREEIYLRMQKNNEVTCE